MKSIDSTDSTSPTIIYVCLLRYAVFIEISCSPLRTSPSYRFTPIAALRLYFAQITYSPLYWQKAWLSSYRRATYDCKTGRKEVFNSVQFEIKMENPIFWGFLVDETIRRTRFSCSRIITSSVRSSAGFFAFNQLCVSHTRRLVFSFFFLIIMKSGGSISVP